MMSDNWRSITLIGPVHVRWFFNRDVTPCMINSSVMSTAASTLSLQYFKLSEIRTVFSACLIYRQVSIDHRWWSAAVIICTVTAIRETAKTCFLELKYEKDVKKSLKSTLATSNSSDLSLGTNCSHTQSRDTIHLILPLFKVYWSRTVCAPCVPLSLWFINSKAAQQRPISSYRLSPMYCITVQLTDKPNS